MTKKIIAPCSSCGALNGIDAERASKAPRCAKCKTPFDLGRPLDLTAAGFDRVVNGGLPVLVDFWAPWCGPCKSMHPVLLDVARRAAGKALVARLNTDRFPEVSAKLGIRGIPTLILFREGREAGRQVGAVPAEQVMSMLD